MKIKQLIVDPDNCDLLAVDELGCLWKRLWDVAKQLEVWIPVHIIEGRVSDE